MILLWLPGLESEEGQSQKHQPFQLKKNLRWVIEGENLKNPENLVLVIQSCPLFVTQWTVACQAPLSSWDSQGKNTGVGCHCFLQGIFPTLRSNLNSLHCRWILYHLSHQGSRAQVKKKFDKAVPKFDNGLKRYLTLPILSWKDERNFSKLSKAQNTVDQCCYKNI